MKLGPWEGKAMSGRVPWGLFTFLMLSHASHAAAEGLWVQLVNMPPTSVTDMHLLSDGTVMARSARKQDDPYANIWYRLTPDSNGHYVQGTWTVIAQSICPHAEFASQILRDGRLFVAGGEYGAGDLGLPPNSKCSPVTGAESGGRSDAEIYDPVHDQWQNVQPPLCPNPLTQLSACMSPHPIHPMRRDSVLFRYGIRDTTNRGCPDGASWPGNLWRNPYL